MTEPLDTCPHDGRPLVLCYEWDGDERGTFLHHWFSCQPGADLEHIFHAEPDGLGDYVAVDEGED